MTRTTSTLFLLAFLLALGLVGYSNAARRAPEPVIQRVAFGSCNDQSADQPMWSVIRSHAPDLWIWLGDNVYADTDDMDRMRTVYRQQLRRPGYRALRRSTTVLGTWDDHDYGVNDGGRFYPKRDSSQQLFLDFLGVEDDDPRRLRRGVYSAHTFGPPGRRVKVILLDTRYHRDTLQLANTENALYHPNPDGDVLGAAQWTWLEDELRSSDAQIHLIGTSIQAIPTQHRWEKWANFPVAREKLFDVIDRSSASGVVLLSGDRHKAELSRLDDVLDEPLYEVTSSGLTHTAPTDGEPNRHRVGPIVGDLNFGLLTIDWSAHPVQMRVDVRGVDDDVLLTHTIALPDVPVSPDG